MGNFSGNRRGWNIFILASILVAAVLIRAPGLGKWCFTIDEYYYYNSVSYILEKGIPQFPGGGYYIRGPLIQYMIAFSSLIFPEKEFAARIVPLIFGVLSIPMFYLICRRFLPVFPAFLCSLILLFSSWHVEFSRYARMYAPFQFAFFSFIYFFHSGYFLDNRSHKIVCWIVAFLSIFIYEGSIFLPFILLLPILIDETPLNRKTMELCLVFFGLIIINYLVIRINYRNIGVVNPYPAELIIIARGIRPPFSLPESDLLKAVLNSIPLLSMYFLCVLGGVYVYVQQLKNRAGFWDKVSITVAALLPLIYQFGLLVFLLLILFISHKNIFNMFLEEKRTWIPYFALTMVFWLLVGSFHENGLFSGRNIFVFLKKMISFLFGYPLLYKTIIHPFSKVTPFWGIFVSIALFASIVHCLFSKSADSRGFLLLISFICILLISTIKTLYYETRYSFFFFPLFYILGYMEIVSLRDMAARHFKKL
jgi:hypothetical protein